MRQAVPNSWVGGYAHNRRPERSLGTRAARAGREPERAAKSVAQVNGGPQRRGRPSLRARPHRLREFHEGAPKQRSAARLREGRKPAQLPPRALRLIPPGSAGLRRLTPVLRRQASCRIYANSNVTLQRKE